MKIGRNQRDQKNRLHERGRNEGTRKILNVRTRANANIRSGHRSIIHGTIVWRIISKPGRGHAMHKIHVKKMRMHLYGYVNCERGLYTALREMEVNNIVTDIEGLTTEFRRKLPRSRKKLR